MNKNLITYTVLFIAVLTLGGSLKMLRAIDTLAVEEMQMPAPISLNVNDICFNISESDFTSSQYCSKDGAFTFYFASTFPNAFTLRMIVDSKEPFRLNHRYEIPFESAGCSSAMLQDYSFGRNDDRATYGWIEFTGFEKEGGILTRDGQVLCSIEGRFGFTAASSDNPEETIEVTEGTFRIPGAKYCDLRKIK